MVFSFLENADKKRRLWVIEYEIAAVVSLLRNDKFKY
jgi:hypothetical protein